MTYSIYHFFADLCKKKQEFFSENKLEDFPFDKPLLSCVGDGKFPDLAIKLNNDNEQFTGGELIELKESKDKYSVASFNSTIPKKWNKFGTCPPSVVEKTYSIS